MKSMYLTQETLGLITRQLRDMVSEGDRFRLSITGLSQRTLDQNKKLQAMCQDISRQVVLDTVNGGYTRIDGLKYYRQFSLSDWRHILMAGFTKAEIVPGIEPGQAVCLYPSSTDLTLKTGEKFIEYIYEFGSRFEVKWSDEEKA